MRIPPGPYNCGYLAALHFFSRKPGNTTANQLNDNIINFYMEMIQERNSQNPYLPSFHCFSTQFYDKLLKSGYQGVHRWTKKVDIFSKDLILFPINYQACHWILAVVNVSQKVIYMYNSAGGKYVFSCFQLFLSFLSAEIQRKKKCDLGALNWDKLSVKCIP